MNQTSVIHSVKTGLTYALLSCYFQSHTKYTVLILRLCHRPMGNSSIYAISRWQTT